MYKYRAKMVKIIDGDTLDALIDLGFEVQIRRRIRLKGINAPESRTKDLAEKKLGLAAKRRLGELLGPSGGVFVLISHGLGKYGRCLGEIFIEEGEESINQQLINEGHAREYKI